MRRWRRRGRPAGGSKPPIIPHPGELIFGLVVFAILYWRGARKYVVPRLEQIFAERTAAIEGGIEKAEKAQAEAAEALERVPGAARRGPRRGRADPRGGPGRGRARSSPRCASGRRPRPTGSPRPRSSRSRPSGSRRSSSCAARSGRLATDLASRIVGESLEDEARAEPRRRPVPRRARGRAEPCGPGCPDAGASRESLAAGQERLEALLAVPGHRRRAAVGGGPVRRHRRARRQPPACGGR